jgi:hypothetical protein
MRTLLILAWVSLASSALAQEFATDRIYKQHYDRSECLARVERQIEQMKRGMLNTGTAQHEVYLNRQARTQADARLPLSAGQQQRLLNPARPQSESSAEMTLGMMERFDTMRRNCR